jgi:antitoxin component YwqK of YwqJK toxin-antitoxin module
LEKPVCKSRPHTLAKWLLGQFCFWAAFGFSIFGVSISYAQIDSGRTKNGQREGLWRFQYPNGSLMALETYSAGLLNGIAVSYSPGGIRLLQENWVLGSLEDSAYYNHSSGGLHRKGMYRNSLYEGIWLTYDTAGRLRQKLEYHKGLPHGAYMAFDSVGNAAESGHYLKGKEDGQFIFWRHGIVFCKGKFANGQKTGQWIYYKPNGQIDRRERF